MKTTGIVLSVFGALSVLGSQIGGNNPIGGLIVLAIGVFLIQRANRKKEEAEKKEKWESEDNKQE